MAAYNDPRTLTRGLYALGRWYIVEISLCNFYYVAIRQHLNLHGNKNPAEKLQVYELDLDT